MAHSTLVSVDPWLRHGLMPSLMEPLQLQVRAYWGGGKVYTGFATFYLSISSRASPILMWHLLPICIRAYSHLLVLFFFPPSPPWICNEGGSQIHWRNICLLTLQCVQKGQTKNSKSVRQNIKFMRIFKSASWYWLMRSRYFGLTM